MLHRFLITLLLATGTALGDAPWHVMTPDASLAPADNPMSGFVPYPGTYDFPHSMEYSYVSLAEVLPSAGIVDLDSKVEPLVEGIASRGNQAILRLYVDYPAEGSGLPGFLRRAGVAEREYKDHGGGRSPDYDDPRLLAAMTRTVEILGKRYDGDPRIAYIQVGLLGHWGEWHTWPREDLFPSLETQRTILAVYARSFRITPLLLSQDALGQAIQPHFAEFPIGLHDDNFANHTLSPEWAFVPRLERLRLADRWVQHPIGGEIAPALQAKAWLEPSGLREDFATCVRLSRASWLLNHHVFERKSWPDGERERALSAAASLGYEFVAHRWRVVRCDEIETLEIEVSNVGVAPLYAALPVQVLRRKTGQGTVGEPTDWNLRSLQPDASPTVLRHALAQPREEGETLALSAFAFNGAKPLRFANREQEGAFLMLLSTGGEAVE